MPKYIIEREIPNAGALSAAELKAISQKSCGVLQQLGPSIQWVQSYVTEDKITCVYIAPNADIIRVPSGPCARGRPDHRSDKGGIERPRHSGGVEGVGARGVRAMSLVRYNFETCQNAGRQLACTSRRLF